MEEKGGLILTDFEDNIKSGQCFFLEKRTDTTSEKRD